MNKVGFKHDWKMV